MGNKRYFFHNLFSAIFSRSTFITPRNFVQGYFSRFVAYINKFRVTKDNTPRFFIQNNSFALLMTQREGKLCISHINLIQNDPRDAFTLLGHVSAGNPQAKQIKSSSEAIAIFIKSHAASNNLSDNTEAVHAYGSIEPIKGKKELMSMLDRLISKYESHRLSPWSIKWDQPEFSNQMNGIVGFKMNVRRFEEIRVKSQNASGIHAKAFANITPVPLYMPSYFKEEDIEILKEFIQDNSSCVLITYNDTDFYISHLNLQVKADYERVMLAGSLEKASIPAAHLQKNPNAIAIFRGPHSYISPSWYQTPHSVPTWNYMVAHLYGKVEVSQSEILSDSSTTFQIVVTGVEGKFKLNQNRTLEDRLGVITGLQNSNPNANEVEIADRMSAGVGCPLRFSNKIATEEVSNVVDISSESIHHRPRLRHNETK